MNGSETVATLPTPIAFPSLPITTCESKTDEEKCIFNKDTIDNSLGKLGPVDSQFSGMLPLERKVYARSHKSRQQQCISVYFDRIPMLLEPMPPPLASEDTALAPSSPLSLSPSLSTRDMCT